MKKSLFEKALLQIGGRSKLSKNLKKEMITLSFSYRKKKEVLQMAIILPDLPYAYDALEPYIDAETMHLKFMTNTIKLYVNNANAA